MDFFSNFKYTPQNIIKVAVVGLLGLVAVVFIFSILQSTVRPILQQGFAGVTAPSVAPSGAYGGGAMGYAESDASYYYGKGGDPMLSTRNVLSYPYPPQMGGTVGNTAEDFEVTDYSAMIETRNRDRTCTSVAGLKARSYVVFESANESDKYCSYSFKVEHARVDEILAFIKELDPKELTENTYTIQNQVEDFTSETEILEKKLASIDETLANAIRAYNEITNLATGSQNVDALAKIIDSRLQLLERLTQERININAELERLSRAEAHQLDRLEYTYFNVNVYERKYVDFENMKDSWQTAIQEFFRTVNKAIQDATVNLLALILSTVPFIIYLFILLIAAKYGWKFARYIWEK